MVSVGCQSFGDVYFMYVHYTFGSVWVAEWPPFGARIQTLPTVWEDLVCSISSFLDSRRSWCVSHIFGKSKVSIVKLENT